MVSGFWFQTQCVEGTFTWERRMRLQGTYLHSSRYAAADDDGGVVGGVAAADVDDEYEDDDDGDDDGDDAFVNRSAGIRCDTQQQHQQQVY